MRRVTINSRSASSKVAAYDVAHPCFDAIAVCVRPRLGRLHPTEITVCIDLRSVHQIEPTTRAARWLRFFDPAPIRAQAYAKYTRDLLAFVAGCSTSRERLIVAGHRLDTLDLDASARLVSSPSGDEEFAEIAKLCNGLTWLNTSRSGAETRWCRAWWTRSDEPSPT